MDKIFIPSLNTTVPRLGFGTMRLPDDGQGNIDPAPALSLLHHGLEQGINYFDTAYIYHSGKSENFLGQHFFATLPRDSFILATKLPVARVQDMAQAANIFQEQLDKLQVKYLDFYLAHSIDKPRWQKFKEMGGQDFLEKLRRQERARFVGFSFHGEPEDLADIIADFDWDFVQLQINYYDWSPETQNARLQYEAAVKGNLPLFVMEPVRGGSLARLPLAATQLLAASGRDYTQAGWALRWVAGLPGVTMTLSGMSDAQQLEENLGIFKNFQPLGQEEQQLVKELAQILLNQPHVDCTQCDYCKEACPQEIPISDIMYSYNDYLRLGDETILQNHLRFSPASKRALSCTACGACAAICPQHLDIAGELRHFNDKIAQYDSV